MNSYFSICSIMVLCFVPFNVKSKVNCDIILNCFANNFKNIRIIIKKIIAALYRCITF